MLYIKIGFGAATFILPPGVKRRTKKPSHTLGSDEMYTILSSRPGEKTQSVSRRDILDVLEGRLVKYLLSQAPDSVTLEVKKMQGVHALSLKDSANPQRNQRWCAFNEIRGSTSHIASIENLLLEWLSAYLSKVNTPLKIIPPSDQPPARQGIDPQKEQ